MAFEKLSKAFEDVKAKKLALQNARATLESKTAEFRVAVDNAATAYEVSLNAAQVAKAEALAELDDVVPEDSTRAR